MIIKIDRNPECKITTLEVDDVVTASYRTGYCIAGVPGFNYKSIIQIGGQEFTGKEFVNWVDFMIGVKAIENH